MSNQNNFYCKVSTYEELKKAIEQEETKFYITNRITANSDLKLSNRNYYFFIDGYLDMDKYSFDFCESELTLKIESISDETLRGIIWHPLGESYLFINDKYARSINLYNTSIFIYSPVPKVYIQETVNINALNSSIYADSLTGKTETILNLKKDGGLLQNCFFDSIKIIINSKKTSINNCTFDECLLFLENAKYTKITDCHFYGSQLTIPFITSNTIISNCTNDDSSKPIIYNNSSMTTLKSNCFF